MFDLFMNLHPQMGCWLTVRPYSSPPLHTSLSSFLSGHLTSVTDEVPGPYQRAGHHGQLWPGVVRHPPLLQVGESKLAAQPSTQVEGVTAGGADAGGRALEDGGGRLAGQCGGADLAVGDVVNSVKQLLLLTRAGCR